VKARNSGSPLSTLRHVVQEVQELAQLHGLSQGEPAVPVHEPRPREDVDPPVDDLLRPVLEEKHRRFFFVFVPDAKVIADYVPHI
jgi:hypothetical protein